VSVEIDWGALGEVFLVSPDAAIRHVTATGDVDFERDVALELLVQTARLWRSLGHHDLAGRFRIDGVTGPDVYSAVADNNVYTNLMAQRNLRAAANADLVLAMHLCPEAFTDEQKARNFAYYEQITVRDSSLSAATQAVLAAETGHLDLAYDYLCETALMDMADLAHNTDHGLHIASLADAWSALVAGFGGLRHLDNGGLAFAPRLPEALTRITFRLRWRGRRLQVEITPGQAEYRLLEGVELELIHHRQPITLTVGSPVVQTIPPAADRSPHATGRARAARSPATRPANPTWKAPPRRAAVLVLGVCATTAWQEG
jgi:trehalose/maltose hydrolase-like predicted phosphorylase